MIFFNIFINDLLLFINEAKLANFADNNAICEAKMDLNEILGLLVKESKVAVKWFSDNNIIENPVNPVSPTKGQYQHSIKRIRIF